MEIPVGNPTQHDMTLVHFTALGRTQPINKIVETDQIDSTEVSNFNLPVPEVGRDKSEIEHPSKPWHPPVGLSHLNDEQHEMVTKLRYEESSAFARDDNHIGCVPSLQMSIILKDDIPVQRSYVAVPKPLYKEV